MPGLYVGTTKSSDVPKTVMVGPILFPKANKFNASTLTRTAICRTLEGIQGANDGNSEPFPQVR